jgi:hypothetical protein
MRRPIRVKSFCSFRDFFFFSVSAKLLGRLESIWPVGALWPQLSTEGTGANSHIPRTPASSTGRCNTTSESEVLLKQEVLGFSGFLQNKS